MPQPISKVTQHRPDIERHHAAGKSLTWIANEYGLPKSDLSRKSKVWGLGWDRSNTATAVKAKVADGKVRRANIVERLYARVETILDRLEADEFKTMTMDKGSQITAVLPFVPTQDEKALAQSLSSYLASAQRTASVDASESDLDARNMLTDLGRALGIDDAT